MSHFSLGDGVGSNCIFKPQPNTIGDFSSAAYYCMWFSGHHTQHIFSDVDFCLFLHIWLNIPGSDLTLSLRAAKHSDWGAWDRLPVFKSWLYNSSNYGTLTKILNLFLPQFPQLQTGDNISISKNCKKVNELVPIKHLKKNQSIAILIYIVNVNGNYLSLDILVKTSCLLIA